MAGHMVEFFPDILISLTRLDLPEKSIPNGGKDEENRHGDNYHRHVHCNASDLCLVLF